MYFNQIEEITDKSGKKVKVSKESGHLVEYISEVNYLFRLKDFKEKLKNYLLNDKNPVVMPFDNYKEYLSIILDNLQDLSVSRDVKRISWGIQV